MSFSFRLTWCIPAIFLVACYPTIDSRGYNPEVMDIQKIQENIDTETTILEKFGSPSTVSTFKNADGTHTWYYISKRTSTTSFYRPETLDQQAVSIYFDDAGVVRSVVVEKGETPVKPVARKTETTGYETSVMRDIFGNFGRYSQKPAQKN
jgi:outer membrane protein assembly factor BamE (lipoprotein component of BamABCDE complex)